MNRRILIFLLAGIMLGIGGTQCIKSAQNNSDSSDQSNNFIDTTELTRDTIIADIEVDSTPAESYDMPLTVGKAAIPAKVYIILKYVDTYNQPKKDYVGGTRFGNYEGRLPKSTAKGNKINYREWDVNPKVKGVNRGAERLVTGDNKTAWYTSDHYSSFQKVR